MIKDNRMQPGLSFIILILLYGVGYIIGKVTKEVFEKTRSDYQSGELEDLFKTAFKGNGISEKTKQKVKDQSGMTPTGPHFEPDDDNDDWKKIQTRQRVIFGKI